MSDALSLIHFRNVRQAGHGLEDLLNQIYPPPPNPDIITLEDVLTRYRLTGLGVPAITALQQAQRILRASKDYDQIGLCEFHIGLIYLHWGHCLAAAQQFAEARRQWSFADETASICLSYFAQGQAQQLALHYELAMGCYHKADQWLPRLRLTVPMARFDGFVTKLVALLKAAQEELRAKMWPADEPERVAEERGEPAEETADTPPPPPSSPEAESPQPEPPQAQAPTLAIVAESPTPPQPHPSASSPLVVLPPIIQPSSPPSVVIPTQETYQWYRVAERQGDFLPYIHQGTWLLVDIQKRDAYQRNELIIIGGDQDQIQGNIRVQPYMGFPVAKRIFLSQVQSWQGSFVRTPTGKISFTSGSWQGSLPFDYVVGVVLGVWASPLQATL